MQTGHGVRNLPSKVCGPSSAAPISALTPGWTWSSTRHKRPGLRCESCWRLPFHSPNWSSQIPNGIPAWRIASCRGWAHLPKPLKHFLTFQLKKKEKKRNIHRSRERQWKKMIKKYWIDWGKYQNDTEGEEVQDKYLASLVPLQVRDCLPRDLATYPIITPEKPQILSTQMDTKDVNGNL